MQIPPDQPNRKSRASLTKYFTSNPRKGPTSPEVEQPPSAAPQPPPPPLQPSSPPPPPPQLPQPQDLRGHSAAPILGFNKLNVANPYGTKNLAIVHLPPLAPPGIHKTLPSPATTTTSTPWSKMSNDEDELFEGGWTRCVLHICGCLCLLVAVLFVLILYLFIMKLVKPQRTAAWGSDGMDYNSTHPVAGNTSASMSDASHDFGGDNAALGASTNAEELYSISLEDAD